MKKLKKILTVFICYCMVLTSGGVSYASDINLVAETTAVAEETSGSEYIAGETSQESYTYTNVSGQLLSYISVENSYITAPDTQLVLIGIGNGSVAIENAILHYTNITTGTFYQKSCDGIDSEGLAFNLDFTDSSLSGVYYLDYIEFSINGTVNYIKFSDIGIDAGFGVNTSSEFVPDGVVVDEASVDISKEDVAGFTITNAEGEEITREELAEAVENAGCETEVRTADGYGYSSSSKNSSNGNIVIVLDPGHGGDDSGACREWNGVTYSEREINLKIAEYCKAYLDQYTGVEVYMTRTDNTSTCMTIQERALFGQSKSADILVSIHVNSTGTGETSATGVEIWYPNENYNPSASAMGLGVGQAILNRLDSLGFSTRECKIRTSDDGDAYVDGSITDYYGINRWCKKYGYCGIIVEHGFINSAADIANMLGSDASLKQLGEADAYALVSYFGLTTEQEYTSTSATIEAVKGSTGAYTLKATNVPNITGLYFLAYNCDGSIIKQYDSMSGGDGCWYAAMNPEEAGLFGVVGIDAYVKRLNGTSYKVGSTCVKVSDEVSYNVIKAYNADSEKTYFLTASNIKNASRVSKVEFVVESGNKKYTYTSEKRSDGSYLALVGIVSFGVSGTYKVTAKATYNDGSVSTVGTTTFDITKPKVSSIKVQNSNNKTGTFDVVISGVTSASGVSKIQVPVWSASDLSDIKWYTAEKQSDGTYLVHVDIANHNYHYATYAIQAYVTTNNGITENCSTVLHSINMPSVTVEAFNADSDKTFILTADGIPVGGIAGVHFAIWNEGLNDLKGYGALKQSDGRYMAFLGISDYKKAGTYYVEAFVTLADGTSYKAGQTSFTIKAPTVSKIAFSNVDASAGTFDITISGISSKSGVSQIRVPVWSTSDLSDLYWYSAVKQSDGSYKATADIKNHKYHYATYAAQAYLTAGNGIQIQGASGCVSIKQPTADISSFDVGDENTYILTADNVPFASRIMSVRFSVWNSGLSDLRAYPAVKSSDGRYMAFMAINDYKKTGTYYVVATAECSDGSTYDLGTTKFVVNTLLYSIMGTSNTTVDQMVSYYNAKATYPSYYLTTDAPTIEAFCKIYLEECEAEGIRAEVAFCQAMKETGFLRYGGMVKIEQFNFAGLGATDSGGTPATFTSVREGIRAQVQHLKGYACTDKLNNTCVDPRFSLLSDKRGCAPYVEWLGQSENPGGYGWATAIMYGFSIRNDYMESLFLF